MTKRIKKNTCAPPRMRDGASYPGGKILRKAQARLAARRLACEATRANLGKHAKTLPESSYRMPGSMSK